MNFDERGDSGGSPPSLLGTLTKIDGESVHLLSVEIMDLLAEREASIALGIAASVLTFARLMYWEDTIEDEETGKPSIDPQVQANKEAAFVNYMTEMASLYCFQGEKN